MIGFPSPFSNDATMFLMGILSARTKKKKTPLKMSLESYFSVCSHIWNTTDYTFFLLQGYTSKLHI